MANKKIFLVTVILITALAISGCATMFYSPKGPTALSLFDEAKRVYAGGRYKQAETYFDQLINEYPNSPLVETSMYYLGRCYQKNKKPNEAIATYRNLIDKYKSSFWVDQAKEELGKLEANQ